MNKTVVVFALTSSMSTQMVRIDAEGNKEKNLRTSKILCVICVLPTAFTDDFYVVFGLPRRDFV